MRMKFLKNAMTYQNSWYADNSEMNLFQLDKGYTVESILIPIGIMI